jgi:hypothetical protein
MFNKYNIATMNKINNEKSVTPCMLLNFNRKAIVKKFNNKITIILKYYMLIINNGKFEKAN